MSALDRTILAVPHIETLSDGGKRALVEVSDKLGIDPDWLAAVISFESGFNPKAHNPSGATGLIQFMPSTAARLGTTTDAIAQMSQEDQIRGPVYQYFKDKGRLSSLEDTYLAVFFPAARGQSDDFVVGVKEGGSDFQAAVYRQNAGFDRAQTGLIRRADIVSTIRSVYNAGKARGRVTVPDAPGLWRFFALSALLTSGIVLGWGALELRRGRNPRRELGHAFGVA
jgi:hypothetical protein